jgi:hypothetical protein
MSNWKKDVNWIPAGDPRNPFPFELLDCRAALSAFNQLISRETTSLTFAAMEGLVEASQPSLLPANAISADHAIKIRLKHPMSGLAKAMPSGAGHKWILQFSHEVVVARRRWTGQTIHVGEYSLDGQDLIVTRLTSEREWSYDDFAYSAAEMEFLLKTLLEEHLAPFPIPPGLANADKSKIAAHGWKAHGPLAEFARRLPPV